MAMLLGAVSKVVGLFLDERTLIIIPVRLGEFAAT